jgi:phage-related protein
LRKIAFPGTAARVIWAGTDRFLAEDYFLALDKKARARAEVLFRKMADVGEIRNELHFRHEGDGIYCFKPGQHRFPCFRDGRDVIVTHGFKKQRDKMPKGEFERAREARRRYEEAK